MNSLKINLEELSDILGVAKISHSESYEGIQIYCIEHLTIGRAISIQPCADGALLVWGQPVSNGIDWNKAMQWLESYYDCATL